MAVDVGCGMYLKDARMLLRSGFQHCIGLDIETKPDLDLLGDTLDYVRTDFDSLSLPLRDESIDLVLCDNVIEHLYYPGDLLQEFHRVLKQDGVVAIITPNQANLKNRVRSMLGRSPYYPLEYWLGRGGKTSEATTRQPTVVSRNGRWVFLGHIREYTLSELEFMLDRFGFQLSSKAILPSDGVPSPLERISKFRPVFFLYSVLERAFPNLAYMISIVATKKERV